MPIKLSFFYVFGAWPVHLLRRELGARQVGAGGGPHQFSQYGDESKRRICHSPLDMLPKIVMMMVMMTVIRLCRSSCPFSMFLEPGQCTCCGGSWGPGRWGQAGAPTNFSQSTIWFLSPSGMLCSSCAP